MATTECFAGFVTSHYDNHIATAVQCGVFICGALEFEAEAAVIQ